MPLPNIDFRPLSKSGIPDQKVNSAINSVRIWHKRMGEKNYYYRKYTQDKLLPKLYKWFRQKLSSVRVALNSYFCNLNDIPIENRENIAKKAFSQYLQNLIYCFIHTSSPNLRKFNILLLQYLISQIDFIYKNPKNNAVVIWQDPKTGFNVFILLIKEGYNKLAWNVFLKVKDVFGENQDGFQSFLVMQNNKGYSALITACRGGRVDIVKKLIELSSEIYKEKPEKLKNFLTQEDFFGFSALITACKEGEDHIVDDLLAIASTTFTPEEFKAYINKQNKYGFTALNACINQACQINNPIVKEKLLIIANKLLAHAANPKIANNAGKNSHDNLPSDWQWEGDKIIAIKKEEKEVKQIEVVAINVQFSPASSLKLSNHHTSFYNEMKNPNRKHERRRIKRREERKRDKTSAFR